MAGHRLASVTLVLALTGCGGSSGDGLDPLPSDTSPSGSSSPTATTPTTAPTSPPASGGIPKTIGIHPRKIVARTAPEKAVAIAFVSYVKVRLTAYNQVRVDLSKLAQVAAGEALAEVKAHVAGLRSRKHHTVGEIWIDISSIKVTGPTAQVTSCMDNTTIDVDQKGKPVEAPEPFFNVRSTLEKAGGTVWVVKTISFVGHRRCT